MSQSGWRPDALADYCDLCGGDLASGEATELGCAQCRRQSIPWDRFVRLGAYLDPLDEWIQEVKFSRGALLARHLGELLATRIAPVVRSLDHDIDWCVVPVPTTFRRRMARGIDHAGEIGRGVARGMHVPMSRALARSHAPSQRSLALSQRASNVAGRFRLARPGAIRGSGVILVDDVSTTGATLRACARALRGYDGSRRPNRSDAAWVIVTATLAVTPRDHTRLDSGPATSRGPEQSSIREEDRASGGGCPQS